MYLNPFKNFARAFCVLQIATLCGAIALTSCDTLQTFGRAADRVEQSKIIAETPAGKIGQDLHTAIAEAAQDYQKAKGGDVSWLWSASKMLTAVQTYKTTKTDVLAALQTWNDGTKAGKSFAAKVASLFSASTGTPETKVAVAVEAVQQVAADKGP